MSPEQEGRFGELDVRPLPDGRNWLLIHEFHYLTSVQLTPSMERFKFTGYPNVEPVKGGTGWYIYIPKGFITDFASIPKPLWSVVGAPAEGKHREAAVIHDALYRTFGLCTRPQADAVLYEGCRYSGCNWLHSWTIYLGVRSGGGASYKGEL